MDVRFVHTCVFDMSEIYFDVRLIRFWKRYFDSAIRAFVFVACSIDLTVYLLKTFVKVFNHNLSIYLLL